MSSGDKIKLGSYKVPELKEIAKGLGITGISKMKKADLIQNIKTDPRHKDYVVKFDQYLTQKKAIESSEKESEIVECKYPEKCDKLKAEDVRNIALECGINIKKPGTNKIKPKATLCEEIKEISGDAEPSSVTKTTIPKTNIPKAPTTKTTIPKAPKKTSEKSSNISGYNLYIRKYKKLLRPDEEYDVKVAAENWNQLDDRLKEKYNEKARQIREGSEVKSPKTTIPKAPVTKKTTSKVSVPKVSIPKAPKKTSEKSSNISGYNLYIRKYKKLLRPDEEYDVKVAAENWNLLDPVIKEKYNEKARQMRSSDTVLKKPKAPVVSKAKVSKPVEEEENIPCALPNNCVNNRKYKVADIRKIAVNCGINTSDANGKNLTRKQLCEKIAKKIGKLPERMPEKITKKPSKKIVLDLPVEDVNIEEGTGTEEMDINYEDLPDITIAKPSISKPTPPTLKPFVKPTIKPKLPKKKSEQEKIEDFKRLVVNKVNKVLEGNEIEENDIKRIIKKASEMDIYIKNFFDRFSYLPMEDTINMIYMYGYVIENPTDKFSQAVLETCDGECSYDKFVNIYLSTGEFNQLYEKLKNATSYKNVKEIINDESESFAVDVFINIISEYRLESNKILEFLSLYNPDENYLVQLKEFIDKYDTLFNKCDLTKNEYCEGDRNCYVRDEDDPTRGTCISEKIMVPNTFERFEHKGKTYIGRSAVINKLKEKLLPKLPTPPKRLPTPPKRLPTPPKRLPTPPPSRLPTPPPSRLPTPPPSRLPTPPPSRLPTPPSRLPTPPSRLPTPPVIKSPKPSKQIKLPEFVIEDIEEDTQDVEDVGMEMLKNPKFSLDFFNDNDKNINLNQVFSSIENNTNVVNISGMDDFNKDMLYTIISDDNLRKILLDMLNEKNVEYPSIKFLSKKDDKTYLYIIYVLLEVSPVEILDILNTIKDEYLEEDIEDTDIEQEFIGMEPIEYIEPEEETIVDVEPSLSRISSPDVIMEDIQSRLPTPPSKRLPTPPSRLPTPPPKRLPTPPPKRLPTPPSRLPTPPPKRLPTPPVSQEIEEIEEIEYLNIPEEILEEEKIDISDVGEYEEGGGIEREDISSILSDLKTEKPPENIIQSKIKKCLGLI